MKTILDNGTTVLWNDIQENRIYRMPDLPPLQRKPVYDAIKRTFDLVGSIVAIVILLIPCLLLSIVIMIDTPGNPIYSQTRLGKDGKPFTLLKFRTMHREAEADGIRWAEENDPRVTKFGRILRQTRLDELPQLINIFLGQMSFVGPRPERPEFYEVFDTYIIGFRQRMAVKPGLTGYAQVRGGYELAPEEKGKYDLEYISQRSLLLDLQCLIETPGVVFRREGAY